MLDKNGEVMLMPQEKNTNTDVKEIEDRAQKLILSREITTILRSHAEEGKTSLSPPKRGEEEVL
jgi:hypothetical protein